MLREKTMPIDKKLYHPEFKKQSQACLKQADYLCQECVSFGSYLCRLGQQFVNLDQVGHLCVKFAVVSALTDGTKHFANFRPFKQGRKVMVIDYRNSCETAD
jgi:hypothetical protein